MFYAYHMSKEGGLARIRLHGNPGTPKGRQLGGLHSIKTHKSLGTAFKILRRYPTPPNSTKLAELLGIIAGDGHIDTYQVSIATNSETDLAHAEYCKQLFEKVFRVQVSLYFRNDCKACVVVVSSKSIANILVKKGMVRGHKINGSLRMPPWVRKNTRFKKAFIRGLFDTDGSVYLDRHTIKGKTYKNIAMLFTNRSLPLLADFKDALENLGLHPTQKTNFAVFLRRKEDIWTYFKLVGSSNPKHLKKIRGYFAS